MCAMFPDGPAPRSALSSAPAVNETVVLEETDQTSLAKC